MSGYKSQRKRSRGPLRGSDEQGNGQDDHIFPNCGDLAGNGDLRSFGEMLYII